MREKFIFKKAYFTWVFELFEDVIDAISCVIEYTCIFSQLNSAIFVKNEGFSWVFWNCAGKYMWVVRRVLFNFHLWNRSWHYQKIWKSNLNQIFHKNCNFEWYSLISTQDCIADDHGEISAFFVFFFYLKYYHIFWKW